MLPTLTSIEKLVEPKSVPVMVNFVPPRDHPFLGET